MFASTAAWLTTKPRREAQAGALAAPARRETAAAAAAQVLHQDEHFLAEQHSRLPPAAAAEAEGRGAAAVAGVDGHGRAWLLLGRRVFLWALDTGLAGAAAAAPLACHELLLPQCPAGPYLASGLGRGFLTCSASGTLKFWPSTSVPASCLSHSMALPAGAAVRHMTCVDDAVWISTSDHALYFVHLTSQGFWPPRALQVHTGVFGLLSWGSWKSGGRGRSPVVRMRACLPGSQLDRMDRVPVLFLMTEKTLEVWQSSLEADSLAVEYDLHAKAVQAAAATFQVNATVTLLDLYIDEPYVFVAAFVEGSKDQHFFALFCLELQGAQVQMQSAVRLNCSLPSRPVLSEVRMHMEMRREEDQAALFLYWRSVVVLTLLDELPAPASLECSCFSLDGADDVVGHGAADEIGGTLLVTRKHGVVSLARNELNQNPAIYQLTEAFQTYLQQGGEVPSRVLARLPTAALAATVAECSQAMVDRLPLFGPNWAEQQVGGEDTTFLKAQLVAKLEKHEAFVRFLEAAGLLPRLPLRYRYLLLEHREKVVAALELWTQAHQSEGAAQFCASAVLRRAQARHVADARTTGTGLSEQDMFFSEVTLVPDLLSFIPLPSVGGSAVRTAMALVEVNSLFVAILCAPWQQREAAKGAFMLDAEHAAAAGPEQVAENFFWCFHQGLRDRVRRQIQATVDVVKELQAAQSLTDILEECLVQLAALCDALLSSYQQECFLLATTINEAQADEARQHLATHSRERLDVIAAEFDRAKRETLMGGLVACGQYHQAKQLAEKYRDFEALITACEHLGDSYEAAMLDRSFRLTLFRWYLAHRQYGKLLQMPEEYADDIRLVATDNLDVSWLYDVQTGNYREAGLTLTKQALQYTKVADARTAFSIAKLAHLVQAADAGVDVAQMGSNEEWKRVNAGLDFLRMQEVLFPPAKGFSQGPGRVLEPSQLLAALEPKSNAPEALVNSFYDRLNVLLVEALRDRVPITNQLEQLWQDMLCLSRWDALASELAAAGTVGRVNLQEHFYETVVYQVASRFSVKGQTVVEAGLLTKEIFHSAVNGYVGNLQQPRDEAVLALLMAVFHQLEALLFSLQGQ